MVPDRQGGLRRGARDRHQVPRACFLLAYTGARIGEASALKVKDLDLIKRMVTIRANSPEVGGKKLDPVPSRLRSRWDRSQGRKQGEASSGP